jgi:hypothetical protein
LKRWKQKHQNKKLTEKYFPVKQILQILFFVFASSIVSAQSLTINGNGKLIMRGNVSLVVRNAALINNGTLINSAGTVQFSGDKDTTFSYIDGTQQTTSYNLSINKGSFGTAIKSKTTVQNILGVYDGILYPDSNLTLRSDKDLTARVDVIPAGANIVGKAIVERYYPKRRAWRLVTSPLTKSSSIFDTWQNKGVYETGANTFVTGTNPTGAGGNGLDASPQNNASMKTWNVNTQTLEPVTNTHTKLSAGNNGQADNTGYFLFVRGDRNTNNFIIPNCTNTTLSSNGQLQTGTQSFTASNTGGGYTLIGNPFASPVDFNNVVRNNLVKRFYVWDPSLNLVGGYVMLDDLDNNGIFTKSISASAQTNHLQSSQAFFVETQANGTAGISFPEPCKSDGNNNALFRPTSDHAEMQSIRIVLHLKENDSTTIIADGVLFEGADGFGKGIDRNDALKFSNINETMSLVRNGYPLAAERSERLSETDTLFIKTVRITQRRYELEILPAGINDAALTAWLEDSYLQTSLPVDLYNKSVVEFTVDGNAASAAANRFRIVFKRSSVLPVTIISVNATLRNKEVLVNWVVANEINIHRYEVERSADGIYFTSIAKTDAAAGGTLQYQYNVIDRQPLTGYNYYRIKYIDENGSVHYSIIVKVNYEINALPAVAVFPNPVQNNIINLQFVQCETGKYSVKLLNEAGQLVYETIITNTNSKLVIIPPVQLSAGNYLLELKNGSSTIIKKILVK